VEELEQLTGRCLAPRKPGPKPKAFAEADERNLI
jgi:hypothetical protein